MRDGSIVPGACRQESAVQGERYRITLLTSQLVRLEYAPDGVFEDRPTQTVVSRDFPTPAFQLWRTERGVEIQTEHLSLFYDEGPFSPNGLWIDNRSAVSYTHLDVYKRQSPLSSGIGRALKTCLSPWLNNIPPSTPT